jgi:hypothetical protein
VYSPFSEFGLESGGVASSVGQQVHTTDEFKRTHVVRVRRLRLYS